MPIELNKNGDKVNLEFPKNGQDFVRTNLSWNRNRPKKSGLLSKLYSVSTSVDLDLGCVYEFKDGKKGIVQALGNLFGSLENEPYILLDGDDRTGDSDEGENILINKKYFEKFKKILFYVSIYEGPSNWAQADATVSVKTGFSDEIIVRLDDYDNKKNICSLFFLEFGEPAKIVVEKRLKFFKEYIKMDNHYKWNLEWKDFKK